MGATPRGTCPSALPSLASCSVETSSTEQLLSFPPLFPVDMHVNNHFFPAWPSLCFPVGFIRAAGTPVQ